MKDKLKEIHSQTLQKQTVERQRNPKLKQQETTQHIQKNLNKINS